MKKLKKPINRPRKAKSVFLTRIFIKYRKYRNYRRYVLPDLL